MGRLIISYWGDNQGPGHCITEQVEPQLAVIPGPDAS
jgi:hypothetical protein